MRIILHKLTLRAREGVFEIPFSESITYFYGKMGAGKSTIPRLVDFCLGAGLEETPALQKEFVSANLELTIGNNLVKLDRQKGSHVILAAWRKMPDGEPVTISVPVQGIKDKTLVPNAKVENISDLIFYLADLEPPFVLKSKYHDTELIRLSIRDLMWYCYLDQDHIDNSFFYLERGDNEIKKPKSRDALQFILGLRYEKIAKLENDLTQAKEDRSALMTSIDQLRSFLAENGIKGTEDIQNQIEKSQLELNKIKSNISEIHKTTFVYNHPIDDLKEKIKQLGITIEQTKEKMEDVDFQISNQTKLKAEFITANMKLDRTSMAREVFKKVHFNTCPQCGQHVDDVQYHDSCALCKRAPENIRVESTNSLSPDLIERIKEIEHSINQLSSEKKELQLILKSTQDEKKNSDETLVELQKDYDSKYLSETSQLLERKGVVEGNIQYFKHMLSLPQKVDALEEEAGDLSVRIDRLKKELENEKEESKKNQNVLTELEKMFADTLQQVNFPGTQSDDVIKISGEDFIPIIYPKDKKNPTVTSFRNLGSGGKKTIFKACFALAIHRLAAKKSLNLPTFLIIDTPMKNISERENKDVFNGFYQFVYRLATTEFRDRQIIIVDKEYYEELGKKDLKISVRHMTPDNLEYPPLIEYYRGH